MKPLFAIQNADQYIERFYIRLVDFLPNFIGAVIILVLGLILMKVFRKIVTRIMTRKEDMDPTAIKFILDVTTWVFRIILFVAVIGKLGIETSSFVAILGAAGLAVGLSLQGSLSNFAGGLLIITFKPFRVGDYIEAQGEGGTVEEIQIFSTRLVTPSNQVIYIPNGALSNGNIRNFSKLDTRRAEIIVGAAYGSDVNHVKKVLTDIIENDKAILKTPEPIVRIKQLADNSVNFQVLVWASNSDYWQMLSDFQENVKIYFDKEGIEIPFPQRDIIIKNIDGAKLP